MKHFAGRFAIPLVFSLGGVAAAWVCVANASTMADVEEELERLMAEHGFEVRGIEQTAEHEGRVDDTALVPRLRLLLDDFDHVIVQSSDGGVDRVLILGEKVAVVVPPTDYGDLSDDGLLDASEGQLGDSILIPTQRKGSSHSVDLTLQGPNGRKIQQTLLIDTGSDHVVLPASLISTLGIAPNELIKQPVQTANGTVDARLGTLPGIYLDDINRVEGVSVAFIEDSRLGGNALLGMSLLGRFLVTIDDEQNQLTLDAP